MKPVVVIPARYASSRLPGKMLREIDGIPLIVRTVRQVKQAGLPLLVACDDGRVAALVDAEDVPWVMTRPDHANGTARLQEVAAFLGFPDDLIVVNVQGDEPLLPPELVNAVADALEQRPEASVATLAARFAQDEDIAAPTAVKVVCDQNGHALYFSRAAIPFVRDAGGIDPGFPYLRHIGIYAYRVAALHAYPHMAATPLEQAENLEQLRFLEHGHRIAVRIVDGIPPAGIDCEADVERMEAYLKNSQK
ncbi:MAG: 3-deoxy-manno-octulosonate cytidylyltransferase [Cardiobacteriaceae bacterium]|nr:3-deoxy-manno-octulosonate cytidylyltransferase [Cardiobacteriaceae bacterium]